MKENKRLLLIIGAVILVIIIIALFTKGNKKDKTATDSNSTDQQVTIISGEKLAEAKEYKGLEVTNVQFKIENEMTKLTADVKNNTSQDMPGQYVNINVLDKEGNRITSIGGYIDKIKAGESTPISSSILSNGEDQRAYDIEITAEREPVKKADENSGNDRNNQNAVSTTPEQ